MIEKVLIVDDHENSRFLMRRTLEVAGYMVSEAMSANQASSLIQKTLFDALVLDVNMPDKDGITFLGELRKVSDYDLLPVLFISARAEQNIADMARKVGGANTEYLTKPVSIDEVVTMLKLMLANTEQE